MHNFLLGLFGSLLATEIGAWCRNLAQKIVRLTAQKLPEKFRSRMLEEWSALLEDIPGDVSKLWMAISLYRQRSVLSDECEKLIDDPLPPLVGIETLTEMEQTVFSLLVEGNTTLQISHILDVPKFTVEYKTITSAQKLTGQSSIGRTDLLKFLGAIRNHPNRVREIARRIRREMRWYRIRRDNDRWRRNGGW